MASLAQRLNQSTVVLKTTHWWFDCAELKNRAGVRLEQFVSAALRDGRAIDWCLSVCLDDEGWCIESDVRLTANGRQHVVRPLPERTPHSFEDFLVQLHAATEELVAAIEVEKLAMAADEGN